MTAKEQFDRNAIESSIKEISTHGEGKLSSVGVLDVVVLKGTFLEMGRQYGHLMKDKILEVRDELIKEYIDPEILGYDTMKRIIGEPFYKSQPKRIKDLYAGISEATGLDVIELSTIDQQFMNTEIYDQANDWKPVDGMTVFENRPKGGDVTVWQIVTHPAKLKMWVRIPTYSGWMEFDLKKLFTR